MNDIFIEDFEKKHFVNGSFPNGFYDYTLKEGSFVDYLQLRKIANFVPQSSQSFSAHFVDYEKIDFFFSEESRKIHDELGILRKDGFLFYGPQGGGKTTIMHGIAKYLNDNFNVRIFFVNSFEELNKAFSDIENFRKKGHFPACIIYDECEHGFNEHEHKLKPMLDGRKSIDDMLMLAATNYFDEIPDSISNRESRFSLLFNINEITDTKLLSEILNGLNDSLSPNLRFGKKELYSIINECQNANLDKIKANFKNHLFFKFQNEFK
jgi:SpoVK/Ycf46/Vps4 family AAA+-type ATPase